MYNWCISMPMKHPHIQSIFYRLIVPVWGKKNIQSESTVQTQTDAKHMATACNRFALDMYRELAAEDKNIFISPWSLNSALSMTYEGARGQTAEEMKTVLHLPENEINRWQSFSIRSKNQCP